MIGWNEMRALLRHDEHMAADRIENTVRLPDVESISLDLLVRCYAEQYGDQWQAFSLEFGLAAQADTLQEARRKLDSMIEWYVHDALTEDREHAGELLSRRAPLSAFARFYLYRALNRFVGDKKQHHPTFNEPVPMAPKLCTV
jgi:hypothetical protein